MIFKLPVAEEKVKRQHVITLHLIVIFALITTGAFLLGVQYLINSLSGKQREALSLVALPAGLGAMALISGFLLLALVIFRNKWVSGKSVGKAVRVVELLLMAGLAVFALVYKLYVPSAIYLVVCGALVFALYWENAADNMLYVLVDEHGIKLPVTSRKRSLEWWEVEQVLLRFSILTIDCHDNRLFQWNIVSAEFDKETFQLFCAEHIAASREKRKKYVW